MKLFSVGLRLAAREAGTAAPNRAFLVCMQTGLLRLVASDPNFVLISPETSQISLPIRRSRSRSCLLDSRSHSETVPEMPLTERDTNIPPKAQTRSSPSHKTPQLHSKLPRFVATPNSAPAATKWTSRVAEPVASVERTARTLRYTPTYKREPTAIQTVQKVPWCLFKLH